MRRQNTAVQLAGLGSRPAGSSQAVARRAAAPAALAWAARSAGLQPGPLSVPPPPSVHLSVWLGQTGPARTGLNGPGRAGSGRPDRLLRTGPGSDGPSRAGPGPDGPARAGPN